MSEATEIRSAPPSRNLSRSDCIIAPCLNPPAITEVDSSEGLSPWILLESRVYLVHRDNSTTAKAKTSKGHAIWVSICFAAPPAVSYVCIHCPDLPLTNFSDEPCVVRSEKQFVLLHLPLWSARYRERVDEYYMYQAIPGKKPMLSRIPNPGRNALPRENIGIYCCDDGEYILAGLCLAPDTLSHELHLYSSKSEVWTIKPARLESRPAEDRLPVVVHKVILLGGSRLGWVDLCKGILVCDVLCQDSQHAVLFIPLPKLMPGNKGDHICPWIIRDITCTNGSLKFIEIEHLYVPAMVQESVPEDDLNTIYDESCFESPHNDFVVKPRKLVGWRAIIWNRLISDNCWRKGPKVHANDDMFIQNPSHSALLAELGAGTVEKPMLMNLLPYFPTLSIHGDDVVHMSFSARMDNKKSQMISIDMRNKTLKTLVPGCPAEGDANRPHFPCVLSNYLSITPASTQVIRVCNAENVNAASPQIVQGINSGNITENQRRRSCADEVNSALNQAQNAGSNFVDSLVVQASNSENVKAGSPWILQVSNSENVTENQHPSSCAQGVIGVPNQAQDGGLNYNFSLSFQVPQQSLGLSDILTRYNGRQFGYADCTRPGYDNYQQSSPLLQRPTYLPNWLHPPSWEPAYPALNAAASGRMVHPLRLNDCHMFQPPLQAPVLPMAFSTWSIPPLVGRHTVQGSRHQRLNRHSPYERPRQMISPANLCHYQGGVTTPTIGAYQ